MKSVKVKIPPTTEMMTDSPDTKKVTISITTEMTTISPTNEMMTVSPATEKMTVPTTAEMTKVSTATEKVSTTDLCKNLIRSQIMLIWTTWMLILTNSLMRNLTTFLNWSRTLFEY